MRYSQNSITFIVDSQGEGRQRSRSFEVADVKIKTLSCSAVGALQQGSNYRLRRASSKRGKASSDQ